MKQNYKLTIAYDGSRYYGWEHQPDKPTIQGKLEDVLTRMTGAPVDVIGAGRTDAGVHAKAMTANAVLDTELSPEDIRDYMNRYLPDDICVREVRAASERFHARYKAVGKTYCYTCYTGALKPVFDRTYVLTLDRAPDVAAMQRAAEKADRYLQTLRAVNTAETSPQEPMQRVQVQEILTRCANDAKLLCENKSIQFVLNNAMENARTIPAQRQALGRALDNILENAVRFTPAGGTITLDAVEEGQEVVFTVTDTGPGFSPEALQKAGRELFTTDAARGQHWGLGLAAARRTAQTHNGTLTVSNGENGGGKVVLRVRS